MSLRMLNIGCGTRVHPDWVNVDLVASVPGVRVMDIRNGLAFPDGSFDIVYHSHVLEHLPPETAHGFLRECARVLRADGVLRVAVPDLERIAAGYLGVLHEMEAGSPGAEDRHTWMTLELLDQMTRNASGGRIARLAGTASPEFRRFASGRWGIQARRLWPENEPTETVAGTGNRIPIFERIRAAIKRRLLKMLLGKTYPAYESGIFRSSGEIHLWMYDRFSLAGLLETAGFTDVRRRNAVKSHVPEWADFHLDTEPDGSVSKPDSLFMEGRKPALWAPSESALRTQSGKFFC